MHSLFHNCHIMASTYTESQRKVHKFTARDWSSFLQQFHIRLVLQTVNLWDLPGRTLQLRCPSGHQINSIKILSATSFPAWSRVQPHPKTVLIYIMAVSERQLVFFWFLFTWNNFCASKNFYFVLHKCAHQYYYYF